LSAQKGFLRNGKTLCELTVISREFWVDSKHLCDGKSWFVKSQQFDLKVIQSMGSLKSVQNLIENLSSSYQCKNLLLQFKWNPGFLNLLQTLEKIKYLENLKIQVEESYQIFVSKEKFSALEQCCSKINKLRSVQGILVLHSYFPKFFCASVRQVLSQLKKDNLGLKPEHFTREVILHVCPFHRYFIRKNISSNLNKIRISMKIDSLVFIFLPMMYVLAIAQILLFISWLIGLIFV